MFEFEINKFYRFKNKYIHKLRLLSNDPTIIGDLLTSDFNEDVNMVLCHKLINTLFLTTNRKLFSLLAIWEHDGKIVSYAIKRAIGKSPR